MKVYRSKSLQIHQKENASPVTLADVAAHQILSSQLPALLADCPVVSEEDKDSLSFRHSTGRFWLIDPLDGTKEFIARTDEFTVNIALIEDGRSVLGVVYVPSVDTLYWGGAGLGAFRQSGKQTQPLKVSTAETSCMRVVVSKSHLNPETQAFIRRLGNIELMQVGSSLKFCRIAEGNADIYPRMAPTCEWDTAAGQAVLEGAGGCVVDLNRLPLRYGKREVINPSFIATRDLALIPS